MDDLTKIMVAMEWYFNGLIVLGLLLIVLQFLTRNIPKMQAGVNMKIRLLIFFMAMGMLMIIGVDFLKKLPPINPPATTQTSKPAAAPTSAPVFKSTPQEYKPAEEPNP